MNTREKRIRKWMIDNAVRQTEIARAVGTHAAIVHYWVKGERQNPLVRDAFIERGLPERTADMKGGAKNER